MLSDYQVDHLLLLVGGNPLPNAVAGKLLVRPGKKITLIHSAEVFGIAQRLRGWLGGDVDLKQVEEANPTSILRGVQETLKGTSSIGLNYTGGTKAMAVHAYQAVDEWAKQQRGVRPVFSYLDARRLRMVIDPAEPDTGEQPRFIYVGRGLTLKLEKLLRLHGWSLRHQYNDQSILPDTAEALAKANSSESGAAAWRQWVEEVLEKQCRRPDRPDKWKSRGQLRGIKVPWPTNPLLAEVVETLKQELQQNGEQLDLAASAATCGYKEIEDFCRWLHGWWLEHLVLDVLSESSKGLCLDECAQNVETNEVQFDVDVVAMRGYQLFAFTCGTDSEAITGGRERLKLKLFEGFIHARQLGGDEARVALVCCSDDPTKLQSELRRDIVDPHIRVFGREHLPGLQTHVARWIKEQSQEEE